MAVATFQPHTVQFAKKQKEGGKKLQYDYVTSQLYIFQKSMSGPKR